MKLKAFEQFCISEKIKYKSEEPMKKHTSFKIGGSVSFFAMPDSTERLSAVLNYIRENEIPFFVLGKGSNILVSDSGFKGVAVCPLLMNKITVNGNEITAEAGVSLTALCLKAAETGLRGLEFAYGIPGSLGGAVFMNAGAYGGEMSQIIKSAEYISSDGEIKSVSASDIGFGYRTSLFKTDGGVITSATLRLENGDKNEITALMNGYTEKRRAKQPLEYPSAGSTFKRPEGNFAGALIEKNGLKGVRVGGAMVSEKHAGFIINYDNATAEDVKGLMTLVSETVLKEDGIKLEPEIIYIGN